MKFLRVVLQSKKIGIQCLYCPLKYSLSSAAPIDKDNSLLFLHVLQAAAQTFQMSDVDVPTMAQMDTKLLFDMCEKNGKLLHEVLTVFLDAFLPDESVPIGDGLDLGSVHEDVLKYGFMT